MKRTELQVALICLLWAMAAPSTCGQDRVVRQEAATRTLVLADSRGHEIDLDFVDYQRALASETLCPDTVVLDGVRIATGHSEASLVRKLGAASRVAEAPHRRSREESVRYFRELMMEHPNTMHFYALLTCQESEGWFKVIEWDSSPVGKLRAHLIADSSAGPYRVQLLHVVLPPVDTSAVRFLPGTPMRLERDVPPRLTWNVSTNTIAVKQGEGGS